MLSWSIEDLRHVVYKFKSLSQSSFESLLICSIDHLFLNHI